MPAQVDQPQWLVQLGDDSLAVLEQERWASPLRDEFRQALLEELIVGQGAIDARTQPAPAAPRRRGSRSTCAASTRCPVARRGSQGSWTITGSDARSSSRCEWLIREAGAGIVPGARGSASACRRSGSAPRSGRRSRACAAAKRPAARRSTVAREQRATRPRGRARSQGRRAMLFCTVFTPRTFIAMLSAVLFSSGVLATPDSTTLPFAVSTWIAVGVDGLVLDQSGLDGAS